MTSYAVIYDRLNDEGDWVDDMYELFDSPEEATKMFLSLAAGAEQFFSNPRVVVVIRQIEAPAGTSWGHLT